MRFYIQAGEEVRSVTSFLQFVVTAWCVADCTRSNYAGVVFLRLTAVCGVRSLGCAEFWTWQFRGTFRRDGPEPVRTVHPTPPLLHMEFALQFSFCHISSRFCGAFPGC